MVKKNGGGLNEAGRKSLGVEEFGGGGGETLLFGLYRDVLLYRVWCFGPAVLNRVYNLLPSVLNRDRTCPKQGIMLQTERRYRSLRTRLSINVISFSVYKNAVFVSKTFFPTCQYYN